MKRYKTHCPGERLNVRRINGSTAIRIAHRGRAIHISITTVRRAASVIKWAGIILISLLLFRWGSLAALEYRGGNSALGGECTFLFSPLLWRFIEISIADARSLHDQRKGGDTDEV